MLNPSQSIYPDLVMLWAQGGIMPKVDDQVEEEVEGELDDAKRGEDPQPSEREVKEPLEDAGAKPAREEDTDKLQRNTEPLE